MNFAELLHLDWRAPAWWLVALTPLLILASQRWRRPRWEAYADAALRPWAIRRVGVVSAAPARQAADWLFWGLLACALAGPRLALDAGSPRARHDIDLVIALDVSSSMTATDIAPSRLERARLKIQDLMARLHGERVALIAYAGEAGVVTPLTHDAAAVREALPLADARLFDEPGTHLAAALELAHKLIPKQRAGAVLVISDAEASSLSGAAGAAATQAAQTLARRQAPLYVLTVASDEGVALTGGGETVISRPDNAGYGELAKRSGGAVARITDSDGDLAALYDRGVLALAGSTQQQDAHRRWRELYGYPLGAALLVLLLTPLRMPRRVVLAAALAASGSAQADDAHWREAYAAFQNQQYLFAQQHYAQLTGFNARMGEGAAAYRRKDFGYAAQQFTQAWLLARDDGQRADALFNLGNAHFFAGKHQAAHDAYSDVLRLRPKDEAARHNLARVMVLLALSVPVSKDTAIPDRNRRGLSDSPNNKEGESELPPDKLATQPLLGEDAVDAERARRTGAAARSASDQSADQRAALKKLELLSDARQDVLKQTLKQDAKRERPEGMPPW